MGGNRTPGVFGRVVYAVGQWITFCAILEFGYEILFWLRYASWRYVTNRDALLAVLPAFQEGHSGVGWFLDLHFGVTVLVVGLVFVLFGNLNFGPGSSKRD